MSALAESISQAGIVAIVRGVRAAHIEELAAALQAGGVRVLEVTLNTPDALGMIARLRQAFGDELLVGAGTVLNADQVMRVADAGGQFIVSPDTFAPVLETALARGLEPLPGALTPTEVRTAVRAGASLVKLFPAVIGGPEYLRQIRAPLDDVRFVPTGGVDHTNAREFIKAGAAALGIGSALVPKAFAGTPQDVEAVTAYARRLVALIAEGRA
jgi:2-dehydro-3-deoxyphosphogluconate aldolase/(4S)-4-hydroxy-2-oxoglutarate aldolase